MPRHDGPIYPRLTLMGHFAVQWLFSFTPQPFIKVDGTLP